MENLNYYERLQVSKKATTNEIKKAFAKKIKQYHSDKNPNQTKTDEQKSKLIIEAWKVLKDPIKRVEYDRNIFEKNSVDPHFNNYSPSTNLNSYIKKNLRNLQYKFEYHIAFASITFIFLFSLFFLFIKNIIKKNSKINKK